ncbi:hypothetical protein EC988_007913 [Linderina pennispora]|nr:hypothetical protein EC988_007913 [Linderina pennispora]
MSTQPSAAGKFWKITLQRSPIGLPPRTRQNAEALGLRRRGNIVYRPITNELAGVVLKLKEIVKLEIVDSVQESKTPASDGFEVIGRMNPMIASGYTPAKPSSVFSWKNKR